MNILLTADFHLKPKHPFTQIIEGKVWDRMCQEKLNTLKKLPAYAKKLGVDSVIIAGDVFDTSNPPEALKAEFVKILYEFDERISITIITGRPGDHDFVSETNYVLMDIKEALRYSSNIYIHNNNIYPSPVCTKLLTTHLMLEGISDFYKKVVPLDDEMFRDYSTILLGDYHAYYYKKFGQKNFIYPGPPFPTRFGESSHSIVQVEVDDETGKLINHKKYNIKTYQLIELNSFNEVFSDEVPYVLKYKVKVDSKELSKTLRKLEELKKEHINDKNCMDVVWQVNTLNNEGIEFDSEAEFSLDEIVETYIEENAGKYVKPAMKLYKRLEAQCN